LVGILFSGCSNGVPKPAVITSKEIADQKKVIKEYYQAINHGKYRAAYNLTTVNYQRGTSYENFVYQYKAYINKVKITSIERQTQYSDKDNGVFYVTFKATYKQKYPYGDGGLPGVHVLQRENKGSTIWKIDSIGVGQLG